MLSPELVTRLGIEVVPLTINIGDHEYLDGVDLDIDGYYELMSDPGIATAAAIQPSSGQFALAYDRLAERGADQIISIHTSTGVAGTLSSARLAARHSSVPVRVIDTDVPCFAMSCAVWAASEAAAGGADACRTTEVAENAASSVGNFFVYEASESCRMAMGHTGEQIPLMSLVSGNLKVIQMVATCTEAALAMAAELAGGDRLVNVALAHADRCGAGWMTELGELISGFPNVGQIMRCRIGPSLALLTTNCCAGMFFYHVN